MREAREDPMGLLWVTLGWVISVLLPLWLLITAVIIQLSPDLTALERISDVSGIEREVRSVSWGSWLAGAWEAGRLLVLAAPLVGVFSGTGWLLSVAGRRRRSQEREGLDAAVASDVVIDGVDLKVRASTSFDPRAEDAEDVAAPSQLVARRIVASGIDLVLGVAALSPAALGLWALSREPLAPGVPVDPGVFGQLWVIVPSLALFVALAIAQVLLLARRGQTLGKRWMALKIVRSDGSEAGLVRAFLVRYAAFGLACALVPVLGWLVVPFVDAVLLLEQRGQTLHDRLSDTQVIDA